MDKNFLDEIPPSRVNIKYVKYLDGATEERDLPLKLLLLGDFHQRDDDTPLEERSLMNINQDNFASIMAKQKLSLEFKGVENLNETGKALEDFTLKFEEMGDFSPERIAEQVPELKELLELRSHLVDLKGRVANNGRFRRELQKVLKDSKQTLAEALDDLLQDEN